MEEEKIEKIKQVKPRKKKAETKEETKSEEPESEKLQEVVMEKPAPKKRATKAKKTENKDNTTTPVVEPTEASEEKQQESKKEVPSQNVQKEEIIKTDEVDEALTAKKRGRKPRGGKLILRDAPQEEKPASSQNIILHLKCSLKDLVKHNENVNKIVKNPLQYDPNVPPEIMTFDIMNQQQPFSATQSLPFTMYETDEQQTANTENNTAAYLGFCKKCNESLTDGNKPTTTSVQPALQTATEKDERGATEINNKIKDLKVTYYRGNVDMARPSCCFWCTYDFANTPYYIPRQEIQDSILVYGNFCTPECAVAYLFKENIDDHTKFERYHLINKFYGAVENYTNSIRPAPNPHYILDRFMGTLTIAEYRKILKSHNNTLVVIDKPMTRVLPEIHTDNDTVGSTYKIKRAEKAK
jgi:hypothetical protein